MWLKKKNPSKETDAPEKLRHSRYYEHDGILRAYANRAMMLAFLCIPTTMLALAFAVYVRLQPPTVIRVDENGAATILGVNKPGISVTQGPGSEPTEFEKRAFVHLFLERYLNFSPTNVSRNWADSLNMMTANLRRTAYTGMQKDDFIGKIEDDQTTSDFQMRSLEASNFDVYMLGKVLWCMVAGRPVLKREYFDRVDNDVTVLFRDDPHAYIINELLKKSVVEDPKDCFSSASDLLLAVDTYLEIV